MCPFCVKKLQLGQVFDIYVFFLLIYEPQATQCRRYLALRSFHIKREAWNGRRTAQRRRSSHISFLPHSCGITDETGPHSAEHLLFGYCCCKSPSLCGCFPGGCTQHRQKLFCSSRQFKPAFFSVLLTALDSIPRAFHFLFESHIKTGEAPLAGSFLFHAFDYVFFANARFAPSLLFYSPSAGMSSRIAINAATETAAPIIN